MRLLSSVSGQGILAQSAQYAPTNSGDVSAIASAYQVVSATATQLYAGTAYLTSVNEAPISAARAGNAANASLATSAYYDGTGRLISALPDSAAVSAIASSYVESGVSSKQDTLSFAYNTADQISSINGSALGGMDEAAVSGIASAYAESAVSSKADSSALSSYALSSDVSGTVDLVSTQSANWGGSALALSAGPGVKLEKVGNTLVASTDETLLWTGSITSGNSATLSESISNFKYIAIDGYSHNGSKYCARLVGPVISSEMYLVQPTYWPGSTEIDFVRAYCSGNKVKCDGTVIRYGGSDSTNNATLVKVVGINRTAEA